MTASVSETEALRDDLTVHGEVAHALLVTGHPEDGYRYALERVTPRVGAQFSLLLILDRDAGVLRPAAQYNWPEPYGEWVASLHVRVGNGPAGLAVEQKGAVEAEGILAREDLIEWHETARELGFHSILALPLVGSRGVCGAVSFYFPEKIELSQGRRDLVDSVARQLAATIERNVMLAELKRDNAALAESNGQLEALVNDAEAWRIERERAMADALHLISLYLTDESEDAKRRAWLLLRCAGNLLRSRQLQPAGAEPRSMETDLLAMARSMVSRYRHVCPTISVRMAGAGAALLSANGVRDSMENILELLVAAAADEAKLQSGSVLLTVSPADGAGVVWHVEWPGYAAGAEPGGEQKFAQYLARDIGATVRFDVPAIDDSEGTVVRKATFAIPMMIQQ